MTPFVTLVSIEPIQPKFSLSHSKSGVNSPFIHSIGLTKTAQESQAYGGKELEHETTKKAKEHKQDMEFALLGLDRDSDVKKSVFKAPVERVGDSVASEMGGVFHLLAKGKVNFSGGYRGNVRAFDTNGDWSGEASLLDDKALKYNINQAIKNSPTLELAHKNIDKMIEQTDNSHTRELLINFKNKFDEVIDEFKKIELNKNVDGINGNGFVMKDEVKTTYNDRAKFELGEYLKNNLKLNDNPITASLNYIYNHHKDMFKSRRDVYNLIKDTLDSMPEIIEKREDGTYYLARSIKEASTNRQSKMTDIVIDQLEAENYIKHLNNKQYSKDMRDAVNKKKADGESVKSSHFRLSAETLGNNPELKNFSSAPNKIIPQKTKSQIIDDIKAEIISEYDTKIQNAKTPLQKAKLISKKSNYVAKELGKRVKERFKNE
ncbi:MAG: hypothetical protein SPI03_03615 [Campylobacter sputorum]|uniref:SU10 major capsid protein n=1 Tax=Campylobacter sputorum TaxID=206 RepID=UPI000B78C5F7|nr:hypothetical protein [Campylobacter sputorum]MDY6120413.1 hypothetical protein [Campylobacter sputorum]